MALKDITVRELTDDDMIEVSEWFKSRKLSHAPAPRILPESAYVAELEGQLLSVVWVYATNSGLVLMDWIATNPRAGNRGIISVQKLFKHVEAIFKRSDKVSACISYAHNDKLARYLEKRCGYKLDSQKVNMCMKVFKPLRAEGLHG